MATISGYSSNLSSSYILTGCPTHSIAPSRSMGSAFSKSKNPGPITGKLISCMAVKGTRTTKWSVFPSGLRKAWTVTSAGVSCDSVSVKDDAELAPVRISKIERIAILTGSKFRLFGFIVECRFMSFLMVYLRNQVAVTYNLSELCHQHTVKVRVDIP